MGLLIKFLLWSRYYLIEMIKLDSPMGSHHYLCSYFYREWKYYFPMGHLRNIVEKYGSINLLWGMTTIRFIYAIKTSIFIGGVGILGKKKAE